MSMRATKKYVKIIPVNYDLCGISTNRCCDGGVCF